MGLNIKASLIFYVTVTIQLYSKNAGGKQLHIVSLVVTYTKPNIVRFWFGRYLRGLIWH